MKLSEVVIDKNTLPTQYEMQIVKSIFDGSEKQEPVTQQIKATSGTGKSKLLTTVVVGIIITFLLVLQPWLNNLFLQLNLQGFIPIFIQVVISLLIFYFSTSLIK